MVEKAFYKIGFIQVGVIFGGDVVFVDVLEDETYSW
jgi:hypothetical protein